MLRISRLALLSFAGLGCAMAQLSSSGLRAKFGPPVDRETFHVPPGFDVVVDYAPGMSVCQVQVPSLMPSDEKVRNPEEMSRRMHEFLADLIPASIRGKEVNGYVMVNGVSYLSYVEYENVTISEPHPDGERFGASTITVRFKRPNCAQPEGR
jgi:hypothetical protein